MLGGTRYPTTTASMKGTLVRLCLPEAVPTMAATIYSFPLFLIKAPPRRQIRFWSNQEGGQFTNPQPPKVLCLNYAGTHQIDNNADKLFRSELETNINY